jgi:surfactin synthase thioesterase subunit
MYFYRWPDNGCFQSSAEELAVQINNLLSQNNSFKKVSLIGHSYGGILVTHVLKHWNATTPIGGACCRFSFIRAPQCLESICGYEPY